MATSKSGPSLASGRSRSLVLVVAAWIIIKVVIGVVSAIAWIVVVVAAIVGMIWAWSHAASARPTSLGGALLVIALSFALAGGIVGRIKGSSFWLWFVISGAVPFIGLLAAICYRSEPTSRAAGARAAGASACSTTRFAPAAAPSSTTRRRYCAGAPVAARRTVVATRFRW